MSKALISALIAASVLASASPSFAGDRNKPTRSGDSFSFGVEREMKESGEKGGTADMNIGIGELQECTNTAGASPMDLKRGGRTSALQECTVTKSVDR